MKRLSVIMIAVLVTIFFTACSEALTIKMTNNHAIAYVQDQTSAKSSDFLELKSGAGTFINVKSTEGEQQLYVKENYNINEFADHQISLKGQVFDLSPLTGFLVYQDDVRPVQALSIDTSRRTLSIASVPNANCEVISAKNIIRTGTKGEKIPFVYVCYRENGSLKMVYIPVLHPEERFKSDTDNVFELYFSGKLKCYRVL